VVSAGTQAGEVNQTINQRRDTTVQTTRTQNLIAAALVGALAFIVATAAHAWV
jgi:hypothetical protein